MERANARIWLPYLMDYLRLPSILATLDVISGELQFALDDYWENEVLPLLAFEVDDFEKRVKLDSYLN